MLKNHFKTAWRSIVHDKVYTLLNVTGLATGMTVALLIGLWSFYQFSYNRFLPNYGQAYRALYKVNRNGKIETQFSTSLMLAGALKKDIPEIQYVTQTDWMGKHGLVAGEKKLYIDGAMASADFLKVFPYPLIQGSPGSVLQDPYSIVLDQSTATALFGNENAMNKTLRIDNEHDLKVTGILRDVPDNSTLRFHYIVPFAYKLLTVDWVKRASTTWNNNSFQTFLTLQPGVNYEQIKTKLKAFSRNFPEEWKIVDPEIILHPLKDWHLYDDFQNGSAGGGFIDYLRIFICIGILVLLIACINFTNLATARSEKRAREVGVRKAIGSGRGRLILQFLTESFVICCIAFLLCLLLTTCLLPFFNRLTGDAVQIPWSSPFFWTAMCVFLLFTSLLAGSRPAFYLSSFLPVKVLKGSIQVGKAASLPRRILVVVQFSCSIALIISTLVIYRQIQYARNRPTGYNSDRLVITRGSADLSRNYTALKNDLLQSGVVSHVTQASSPVTNLENWNGIDQWQGQLPNETLNMATVTVSADYFTTMGMQLLKGHDFTGNITGDSGTVILNEAAVKRMRFKDPLNQTILWNGRRPVRVIGVVKDALMLSPFSPAEPTFFVCDSRKAGDYVLYRLTPGIQTLEAIQKLTPIFNRYNPAYPYEFHFTNETYASKFALEILIGKLAGIFAALAIFISCAGLFGLAAYVAYRRTKEIGIRKVLGASVPQIWLLLSREFIFLVAVSCMLASPLAWYFLQNWLQKYPYHISIGASVFIAAAAITLVITLLTISLQAIKAAVANPVKSLRTE
jgi:ABC-type antimicrobial peptide transport system permease subunit